jgi:hypothetical protein
MSKYLHKGRLDNSRKGVTAKKADPHHIKPTDFIMTAKLWWEVDNVSPKQKRR